MTRTPNDNISNFVAKVVTSVDENGVPTYSPIYTAPDATDKVQGDVFLSDVITKKDDGTISIDDTSNAATGMTAATPQAVSLLYEQADRKLDKVTTTAQSVASEVNFNGTVNMPTTNNTVAKITGIRSGGSDSRNQNLPRNWGGSNGEASSDFHLSDSNLSYYPDFYGNLWGAAYRAEGLTHGRTVTLDGSVSNDDSQTQSQVFNGTSDITIKVPALDASHITTGTISRDRLPNSAIEVLHDLNSLKNSGNVYENKEAALKALYTLTADDVQDGDTVSVAYTNSDGQSVTILYMVVNDTSLDSETGYKEYSAGTAAKTTGSFTINVYDSEEDESPKATATFNGSENKTLNVVSKQYKDFTGATATTNGSDGLVPAPAAGQQEDFYLRADGQWAEVESGTVEAVTYDADKEYDSTDKNSAKPSATAKYLIDNVDMVTEDGVEHPTRIDALKVSQISPASDDSTGSTSVGFYDTPYLNSYCKFTNTDSLSTLFTDEIAVKKSLVPSPADDATYVALGKDSDGGYYNGVYGNTIKANNILTNTATASSGKYVFTSDSSGVNISSYDSASDDSSDTRTNLSLNNQYTFLTCGKVSLNNYNFLKMESQQSGSAGLTLGSIGDKSSYSNINIHQEGVNLFTNNSSGEAKIELDPLSINATANTIKLIGTTTLTGTCVPSQNQKMDLGSANLQFNTVYANLFEGTASRANKVSGTINISGDITASTVNLTPDNSDSTTLKTTLGQNIVGTSNLKEEVGIIYVGTDEPTDSSVKIWVEI
jgi:hypothetical protein